MHSTPNPKQADPHPVMVARADVAHADEEFARAYEQIGRALNPNQTDPRHVLVRHADEELAHAYEQITQADEEIARAEEQLSKLERDAARTAALGKRPSLGGPAVRGFVGLILTACIGVAAIVWQSSYGDTAKQIVASWALQFVPTSSLPLQKPALPAQPSPPAVQAAVAKTVLPQPAPLAQSGPEDVAPTAAAPFPELAHLLQTMARDLATVEQEIEHLKSSQEQMVRDNAEQFKATQEQMTRLIATATEQNLRPKISAPTPRPTAATATRKPVPTLPPQATAQPQPTGGPSANESLRNR